MLIIFVRAIFLYILIIFSLRLMGKRQLGELQPTELVITILISNLASLPIENTAIPMIVGIIPIMVLVACELIVSNVALKNRNFRLFLSGRPIIVISEGVVDQKALHKLRFSIDDLMESLRSQGVFDIKDVHYAIVETTGTVSVLQKFEAQTVTPKMINLKGENDSFPIVVISDGKLVEQSLQQYNIPMDWLNKTLKKNKQSLSSVFLMTVDKKLEYYLVPKGKAN